MQTTKSDVRNDFYERQHQKNLPGLIELVKGIREGKFKLVSYIIDEPEFGHRRVIILLHEEKL